MNMPILETERLILRAFTPQDLDAFYRIYSDPETNRFLPWFPLKSIKDAEDFYAEIERRNDFYHFAICLKEDDYPIGYINVSAGDSRDLGYGLRSDFWRQGIAAEAGRAVVGQLKRDGVPFITATHDVDNPRSGKVMQQLGMRYQYSYEEQWQPKNLLVVFRLYQLNLDGNPNRVYQKYWEQSAVHFVETIL